MCLILKSVKKSLIRLSLLGTMVFTTVSYGQNAANTPKKGDASVTNVKVDTVCVYRVRYGLEEWRERQYVFRNGTQLASLLKSTGYDDENNANSRIFKKMTHQPDFKKWTYFATIGPNWPRTAVNFSYVEDTVAINYTEYLPPKCDPKDPNCYLYSSPPPVVVVYFIPFTEKTIKFANDIKRTEKYELFRKAGDI